MQIDQIIGQIARQRDLFQSGATRDPRFRKEYLYRLGKTLDEHEKDILEALRLDLGKAPVEAYSTELGAIMGDISYMLKNMDRLTRSARVATPLAFPGGSSRIVPEPLGVVLVIGPWNYPFHLLLRPLIGALAAGNCVLLKPSELAPNSSALMKNLIEQTFPREYVNLLEGGEEVASALLEQRFDFIFYTGGPVVGRIVMQAAVRHLTPLVLELGGKSPCIVDYDIDLQTAARRIAFGKFVNAGQTCVAPDYLLVHRKIRDNLIDELKKAVVDFYGEDPRYSADYGRIINERHFNRLAQFLGQGKVIWGGQTCREERYIAPTLLEKVDLEKPVMQEEIFGPVLPVIVYDQMEEALDFINKRPRPLALYVFTRDKARQEQVIRETSSGGVCVNDALSHILPGQLPFGGVGESGMGQYHGEASFKIFSHYKSVLKTSFNFDIKEKYPPYRSSLKWIKRLMRFI